MLKREAPVLQAAASFLLAGKTPALVTTISLSVGSPPATCVRKGLPLACSRRMDTSLCAEIREGARRRGLFSFPEMSLQVGIRSQAGLAGCSYLLRYVPQRRLSSIAAQTLLLFQQVPAWWVLRRK